MKKIYLFALVAVVIIVVVLVYIYMSKTVQAPQEQQATSTPVFLKETVVLSLYEKRNVQGITVNPWAVLEDSRCAKGLQCIWAGRVKVGVAIKSSLSDLSRELGEGEYVTIENFKITLIKVEPYPVSTHKTEDGEYRFIFTIETHDLSGV